MGWVGRLLSKNNDLADLHRAADARFTVGCAFHSQSGTRCAQNCGHSAGPKAIKLAAREETLRAASSVDTADGYLKLAAILTKKARPPMS